MALWGVFLDNDFKDFELAFVFGAWLPPSRLVGKDFRAFHDPHFDFLAKPGEQPAGRFPEYDLVREHDFQAWPARESFIPGNLRSAAGAQQEGQFLLRKRGALSERHENIGERLRHEI